MFIKLLFLFTTITITNTKITCNKYNNSKLFYLQQIDYQNISIYVF